MSTRATYCFQTGDLSPKTTIYVHHDGYPEGAAHYFEAMVEYMQDPRHRKAGGFAEAFLRANDGAMLTAGHDVHGDTEYQYDLIVHDNKHTFFCHELRWTGDDEKTKKTVFRGTLADFLNTYAHDKNPVYRMWHGTPAHDGHIQNEYHAALIQSLVWWLRGMPGNAGIYGFDALSEDDFTKMDSPVFRLHTALQQVSAAFWAKQRDLNNYKQTAAGYGLDAHDLLIAELLNEFSGMTLNGLWNTIADFEANYPRARSVRWTDLDNKNHRDFAQRFLSRCETMQLALETLRETTE